MWIFLLLALAGACQTNQTCSSKVCLDGVCACQISTPEDPKEHNEKCMCKDELCDPWVQVTKKVRSRKYCFKDGCGKITDDTVGYVLLIALAAAFLSYICVSVAAFVLLKKDGEKDPCKKAWERGFCILNERCKKDSQNVPEGPKYITPQYLQ